MRKKAVATQGMLRFADDFQHEAKGGFWRVSCWDHETDGWLTTAATRRKWQIRRAIRELRECGYDDETSIFVEHVVIGERREGGK
jgi:hypothetical protein